MISLILDLLRLAITAVAFFLGYLTGFSNGYNPVAQLHIMIPLLISAIAGISGLEGLFAGKAAALAKGYETGSNYQRQSAIGMLSYTAVAILIFFLGWGIKAELTIFFAFLFFLFFSGINHAADALRRKNFKWQNINRPFLAFLLIAGSIYPVIMAMKEL
jgi:hypothetical protein